MFLPWRSMPVFLFSSVRVSRATNAFFLLRLFSAAYAPCQGGCRVDFSTKTRKKRRESARQPKPRAAATWRSFFCFRWSLALPRLFSGRKKQDWSNSGRVHAVRSADSGVCASLCREDLLRRRLDPTAQKEEKKTKNKGVTKERPADSARSTQPACAPRDCAQTRSPIWDARNR